MGFVFYDVETTGLSYHFDQILQFAAIRTDADLNELDRFEIRCRLLPHVVPSPKALTVTGVPIGRALDPSLPTHYEMVCEIARRLAGWSPAIFLGWNSLEFDEHMLRQALYQNLHWPYVTNTEGCNRTDLMKLAQALSFLQPGALTVPTGPNGKLTFKLELFAPANGVEHGHAHDALADVAATVQISRLLRDRAPDQWSDALRFSQKAAAAAFLEDETACLITECYFGNPYQFALAKIGVDAQDKVLAFDLEADPDELRPLTDEALIARLKRKIKPVRRVRTNASPLLHPIDAYETFHGYTPDELLARAENVRADHELCARLCEAAEREDLEPSEHVEMQIYDSFSAQADRARMEQFHLADWNGKAGVAETFEDQRLVHFGRRLIYLHSPTSLTPELRTAIEIQLAHRMTGHGMIDIPWTTLASADAEAVTLLASCSQEEASILQPLRAYFAAERERCQPPLGPVEVVLVD